MTTNPMRQALTDHGLNVDDLYDEPNYASSSVTANLNKALAEQEQAMTTTDYNHEAVELGLYIANTNEVYQLRWAYFATLDKHWRRGRFSKERALVLLERYVSEGAKRYHAEHGTPSDKWYTIFTPVVRREVAQDLLDEYIDQQI